ncbi:hypothetical protein L2755_07370 [Shewanella abyssi]|uniref:hypothetical protein n=1 Tax=Shewanella abyssi TaxID=311789 RepID=UPI00200F796A|nr:hypothetical protein [Shewanella abyssi]MCL1049442.1 hypothetical protein [Shewanella abyssi]
MNKNNDIEHIKQALTFLAKAENVSTDPKIILGLEPELNTLSTVIKKDLLRRINSEN